RVSIPVGLHRLRYGCRSRSILSAVLDDRGFCTALFLELGVLLLNLSRLYSLECRLVLSFDSPRFSIGARSHFCCGALSYLPPKQLASQPPYVVSFHAVFRVQLPDAGFHVFLSVAGNNKASLCGSDRRPLFPSSVSL